MNKFISFLLVILILSGCSSLKHLDEDEQLKRWDKHQASVKEILAWKITGRLSVKNFNDSAMMNIHWAHSNDAYEIRLIAALGQGTFLIKGSNKGVSIQTPKNEIFTANTLDQLIYEQLRWDIDLNALKFWIRGVPEPNIKYSQLFLDENGRLSDMKQSDFTVSVLRYQDSNGLFLPEKLFIKGKNIQLRLIINNWDI